MSTPAVSPVIPPVSQEAARSLAPGLAVFGGLNIVGALWSVGLGLVLSRGFSSMFSGFGPMVPGGDVSSALFTAVLQAAAITLALGVFQVLAWRSFRAGKRYLVCCVALASLLLPWSSAPYLGGAFALYALYRMTRPGVRQSFT